MNKSQAREKIMDVLERKSSLVAPGRFPAHLLNEIGLSRVSDQVRGNVLAAVDDLAEQGKITVEKAGKNIIGIAIVRRTHVDRTECSPEYGRQSRHARSAEGRPLPAFLPDSMVGPLQVRVDPSVIKHKAEPCVVPDQRQAEESESHVTEESATEASGTVDSSIYKTGDVFHETLTECLNALRMMAGPDGVSEEGVGVRQVMLTLGLTENQAGNVMEYLRGMKLYTAEMTGFQKSTYKVALEPAEITPEMVREQRAVLAAKKSNEAKKETPSEPQVVLPLPADLNPLDKMAEIIVGLEAQIADLSRKLESAKQRLDSAATQRRRDQEKLSRRESRLAKAQEENDRLKKELKQLQNQTTVLPSSSLAADVLSRYS